jgi:hypothetical protein
MAKKQNDELAVLDAEMATLRSREMQLLAQHRTAADNLMIARDQRQQQIIDGNDDVEALGRAAANIAEAEHYASGLADACSIVAQKLKQLATKRAETIRWKERERIAARMTTSVEAINKAWEIFKPARDALVAALETEAAIFEIAQTVEHLRNQCGPVLEVHMPVIIGELQRGAGCLLNPELVNPMGIEPLPTHPTTPPQILGKPTGPASVRHGAEWPARGGAHSSFPLGEIPEPKQAPTREETLAQNREAYREMFPNLLGDEDTRTAEQIFADEQAKMRAK